VTSREFQDRLTRRARRAGITIPAPLSAKLEAYFQLLATWNQKINLSGMDLTDPTPEALDRLLLEPVVAAKHVPPGASSMIDIGSGGGSPAIPFALAAPGLRLLMVESKTRKSVFLREAARILEMNNAMVATARFEELQARQDLHETHDLLTIRAVRVEPETLIALQAFVKPGGQLLLFGTTGGDERRTLFPPLSSHAVFPLVDSTRSRLTVIRKA
jgi:16S rRNA (guanine527-N7)-methyltransferase